MSAVGVQAGDFKSGDIATALDPYLESIAEEMEKYCSNKKTVVFLPLVKTSQKFRDILNNHGFKAAEVNGDSKDRAEILEALAKQLSEMKRRKKRLVDPLQFEMSIQAEDLSGYVPAFGWEMAPPSEGQKKTLEKLGILPDAIENAGKASKILDRLDKRRREGLTTPKQIRFLESRGFQHVGTWQFETAKNMIDRIAGNGWRVPSGIIPAEYRG